MTGGERQGEGFLQYAKGERYGGTFNGGVLSGVGWVRYVNRLIGGVNRFFRAWGRVGTLNRGR